MKRRLILGTLAGLAPSLACALVVILMAAYDAAEKRRQQAVRDDTRGIPGYGDNE